MENVVCIENQELEIKEWNGQRVVTLADIDNVHRRPVGTAKRNFVQNKRHLIENEDYYIVKKKDVGTKFVLTYGFNVKAPNGTLITESGYLLLVKSFTDDLAWQVQRQLINTYFTAKEFAESIQPMENALAVQKQELFAVVDRLSTCAAVFQNMMEYTTINYKQQQELLMAARVRINRLLGGAKTEAYKTKARIYFKNLWLDFCENFQCGTYKDLNPIYLDMALDYIAEWEYRNN